VSPGLAYGEALLAPTVLYAQVTEALWRAGIVPHYCANITGHGWRKLLRHPAAFSYRIDRLPAVPPVLRFIQRHAGLDDRAAYGTFNMGAGFALFVAAEQAAQVVDIAQGLGIGALLAGSVHDGPKQLTIEPLALRFGADDLHLR
jgi:phosphoribosylformylglycinamidine cyclo-ligase